MAELAVEFLLNNLRRLLGYNTQLIGGIKGEVQSLFAELRLMEDFVRDVKGRRDENTVVKLLVKEITDVVFQAEDAIDEYVFEKATQKSMNVVRKTIQCANHIVKFRAIAENIQLIKRRMSEFYDLLGFEAIRLEESSNQSSLVRRHPAVEEDGVVGFDEEAETLIDRLTGGAAELKTISIVGMGGLGKTTLAKKVFNHPSIQFEFIIRAWICVSQVCTSKEIFLGILRQISHPTDDLYRMSDEMLAGALRRHLHNKRYLIVLDDVWTIDAWYDLKIAFPNNNQRSRILLTCRNKKLAIHANPVSKPHQLRFMTANESWELLQKKVFGGGRCPQDLEIYGKQIARKCYGLPLAIAVIAGILVKKENTSPWWEKAAKSVSSCVTRNPEECMDVLALSYNNLPYDLKACFLYCGVFPEDYEIPARKLIHLWVAEGFVQETGVMFLEEIAEAVLEDLVDENLVLVEKRRSNGRIKTCRIHNMLYDLCTRLAQENYFFQKISKSSSIFNPQKIFRRLCADSQVLEYIQSKPYGPRVRSFLCSASQQINLPPEDVSSITGAFKLVRVLDIKCIRFPQFPIQITDLVHLKYVALSGDFKVIPAKVSNLWNLQTLIIDIMSRELDIQADIWNMIHLRHLYTNASSSLPNPYAKTGKGNEDPLIMENLQTLSTVSPDSCAEYIVARAPNLKKLGVRGKLITLVEDQTGHSKFDNLARLDHLETLKLLNDTFPHSPQSCRLESLPQSYKFPPQLSKLTLSRTLLHWEHMSTLEKLPNLEVLKLEDYAFMGQIWEAFDEGFLRLKFLKIEKTDLLYWKASNHHFPRLQHILLIDCFELKEIPYDFGYLHSLQTLKLFWPSLSAVASARQIQQKKQEKLQEEQSASNKGLHLVIYPPGLHQISN